MYVYDSLLVATDGSEDAATAIAHAVELARRLEIPLYGIAVLDSRTAYDSGIVDPETIRERQTEQAEEALAALEERATDDGVSVTTTIRSGTPHEEILAEAEERGCSAIVVGSRGRSAFREALLGSTVDALVRLSSLPVLVVDG